jgi:integrase
MSKTTLTQASKSWNSASIHFLTQSEMRALLDSIPSKRDYAIFLPACRHGLRASEIGLPRREDLDLKQYRIRIHRLKNSLAGLHPLQPDEVTALNAYLKARDRRASSLFCSGNNPR